MGSRKEILGPDAGKGLREGAEGIRKYLPRNRPTRRGVAVATVGSVAFSGKFLGSFSVRDFLRNPTGSYIPTAKSLAGVYDETKDRFPRVIVVVRLAHKKSLVYS